MTRIGILHTDFPEKFGVPRQPGLVPGLTGTIVLEPDFGHRDWVRGIEEFSHLWILWGFSENPPGEASALVRPPRLGGREKRGVFATRSPFRPNPIGLTSVRLLEVGADATGATTLLVEGVDMVDGSPVYDIKPYLPYSDAHPEAVGGFGDAHATEQIPVDCDPALLALVPEEKRATLLAVLAQDPRGAWEKNREGIFAMAFGDVDVRFAQRAGRLEVLAVVPGRRGGRGKDGGTSGEKKPSV